MHERPLAAALPAGVDGFLGDGDINLTQCFDQIQPAILDLVVRVPAVYQSRHAGSVDLADGPHANEHVGFENQADDLAVQIVALRKYGVERRLDRREVLFLDSVIEPHTSNFAEPAPAIPVVPGYLDVLGFHVLPPLLEIIFRNVERRRGDEMVEDYVVLLAPAESAQMVEVVVVEKAVSDRLGGDVRGTIHQLRR